MFPRDPYFSLRNTFQLKNRKKESEKITCLTLAGATNSPRFQGARPWQVLLQLENAFKLGRITKLQCIGFTNLLVKQDNIALEIISFILFSCLVNSMLCYKENLDVDTKGIASLTGGGFQEDPVNNQVVMKPFEILQENIINDMVKFPQLEISQLKLCTKALHSKKLWVYCT